MKSKTCNVLVRLFACAVLFACKKEKAQAPENLALKTKTESEIRALMVGRWKLHYTINYTPIEQTVRCNECYWDITAADTLVETYSGAFYSKQKISYKMDNYNGGTWLMSSASPTSVSAYLLDSLRRDTLVSIYPFTHAKSYLTRQ